MHKVIFQLSFEVKPANMKTDWFKICDVKLPGQMSFLSQSRQTFIQTDYTRTLSTPKIASACIDKQRSSHRLTASIQCGLQI